MLLLVALGLRLTKIDWDEGHAAHPDERHIVMVTAVLQWPERLSDLLDPRATTLSPFSRPDGSGARQPEKFAYGHLPLYLLKAVTSGLQWLSHPARALLGPEAAITRALVRMTDHQHMTLTGRVISALFDTGTVLLLYLLGRRLFGRWAGLLAASLLAFTVLNVQLAHFYTSETLLAFFIVLTLYWLVRLAEGGGRREAIWAGVAFGLALACKTTAAPLALAWLVAFLLREHATGSRDSLRLMAWSAAAGALVFAVTSPYVLLDLRMFLISVDQESKMVRGVYDFPYTRQYRGTPAYIYQVLQQLRWGMGWLPGLLGFGALAWASARFVRRTGGSGEAVLVAWCLPYFVLTGSFMVKFMRYMSPLVPLLYVLAGGMVVTLARRLPRLRYVIAAVAVACLLYAVLWTGAFASIYTRPFTRQAASEWIYRNTDPATDVLTNEEWDDQLPYGIVVDGRGRSAGEYQTVAFPLQEPDDLTKVEMLVDRLTRADYIVITSNRFYGWLPRLRERFPVSNRYYDLLFADQLGFHKAAEFASYPSLGPIAFVDDHADESFTVYDHPKVLIYRKTEAVPPERLRALFMEALAQTGERVERQALLLPSPVDEYPSVSAMPWNPWARDGAPAVIWWWLVGTALALAVWPMLYATIGRLWAGGWAFARGFGLLALGYLPWLATGAGLTPANTPAGFALALVALAVAGGLVGFRQRQSLLRFARERWRELLLAEALALAAYLLFVLLRLVNPDLWHPWWGGERPMEMGFLLGILKSGRFPPYDPFYAGGYINYYYYGLYLISALIKLSGVPPEVAFNLALASTYSATVAAAGGVAASLAPVRRWRAALWAAALVALLGNLDGGLQLVRQWSALGDGALGGNLPLVGWLPRMASGLWRVVAEGRTPPTYDFWGPTRVIPDTINEFPYFSFLYGDLHPHIIDMAAVLLGVAVAVALYGRLAAAGAEPVRWRKAAAPLALLAFLAGAAIATNTWDAPLLLALAGGAVLLAEWRHGWRRAAAGLALVAAAGAVGALLYLPFLLYYKPPPGGFAVTQAGSPFLHFVRVWGLFAVLSLGVCLSALRRGRARRGTSGFLALSLRHWRRLPRLLDRYESLPGGLAAVRSAGLALSGTLLILVALVVMGRAAAALALLLALVALQAAVTAVDARERLAAGVLALAWLVLLGTELIYLKDWLAGGSAYRMNTVFKFGIQAWLLLGVGCGALAHRFWRGGGHAFDGWRGVAAIAVCLAAAYPVFATPVRLGNRFPWGHPPVGTLNAFAFMTVGEYFWPDDQHHILLAPEYEALRWLRDNVSGTPVVAEAAMGYYREGGSRVAAYTGLPIPLGTQHESEQRPDAPIGYRSLAVQRLYATTDPGEAWQVILDLDISYVYFGRLERIAYGEAGLAKFAEMVSDGRLELAFANEQVSIYRVVG